MDGSNWDIESQGKFKCQRCHPSAMWLSQSCLVSVSLSVEVRSQIKWLLTACPRVYILTSVLVAYLASPFYTYEIVTSLLPYIPMVLGRINSDSVIPWPMWFQEDWSQLWASCCFLMFLLLLRQCLSLLAVERLLTKYALNAWAPTQRQEGPPTCAQRPDAHLAHLAPSLFAGEAIVRG